MGWECTLGSPLCSVALPCHPPPASSSLWPSPVCPNLLQLGLSGTWQEGRAWSPGQTPSPGGGLAHHLLSHSVFCVLLWEPVSFSGLWPSGSLILWGVTLNPRGKAF